VLTLSVNITCVRGACVVTVIDVCLQYMSLMAELGQGPAPATGVFTAGAGGSIGARPQIHQHQSRVNYLRTC